MEKNLHLYSIFPKLLIVSKVTAAMLRCAFSPSFGREPCLVIVMSLLSFLIIVVVFTAVGAVITILFHN